MCSQSTCYHELMDVRQDVLGTLNLRDGTEGSYCSHVDVRGYYLCHSLCYRCGYIHGDMHLLETLKMLPI